MGAGVLQPQFPSCPGMFPCGGASSGEKPQSRAARRWVNIPAAAFVPPAPGGTGRRKNALGKQDWSGTGVGGLPPSPAGTGGAELRGSTLLPSEGPG